MGFALLETDFARHRNNKERLFEISFFTSGENRRRRLDFKIYARRFCNPICHEVMNLNYCVT